MKVPEFSSVAYRLTGKTLCSRMVAACLFSGVEERHFLFCIRKIQASVITCQVAALLPVE
ncbi:MAG: hypothetical protein LBP50_06075 [Tannerella sp.]|jgi:hypothetical protein|nr:hypothetical protein [Tannerella sp.]